jgi:aminoglycoside 2''-phosphotransferase
LEAVGNLIRQWFPDVPADRLEALPHPGWGGDSDAWLVDDRWIFRFPRTAEIARSLAVEVCLLPRLTARLPLAIPDFVHIARDQSRSPMFVGYEAIPGVPLREDILGRLSQSATDQLGTKLGHFLRALHQTPLDLAIECGVALPTTSAFEAVEQGYRTVREKVFAHLGDDDRAWVGQRFEAFLGDPRHFAFSPVLCHGDFSSDHLLVDLDGGALIGVIDFGDVTIGDPAGEFTWRAEYGEVFFEQVLEAYSIADESLAERVGFRIDCLPITQIAYGLDTDQPNEVAEGLAWLRQSMRSVAPWRRG